MLEYRLKCKQIFYAGENIRPRFSECDYAFSFEDKDEKEIWRYEGLLKDKNAKRINKKIKDFVKKLLK